MPTLVPVRGLGQHGILTDPLPHDLPLNAFSAGRNVSFRNGMVHPYPSPHLLKTFSAPPPVFAVAKYPTNFTGGLVVAHDDFTVSRLDGTALYPMVLPGGWTGAVSPEPYTASLLAGVMYLNRPTNEPLYYKLSTDTWTKLPGWDAGWRCRSLRSFNDYMIALNVTKGAVEYPRMFKWSNGVQDGSPPPDWIINDPTKRGGENIVTDAAGDLIDGAPLRNNFVLYTSADNHLLEPTGDSQIFVRSRLFGKGVVNQNCIVEDSGVHYVFGPDDIYIHDGLREQSILNGKNRNYIYRRIRRESSKFFFAADIKDLNSVLFAFSDRSDDTLFPGLSRCTTGALYNKGDATWTFIDLPNATGFSYGSVTNTLTYAEAQTGGITYADISASYADLGGSVQPRLLLLSYPEGSVSSATMLIYEDPTDIQTTLPAVPAYVGESWVERAGIVGSALGDSMASRVQFDALYPYASNETGQPFKVYFKAALTTAAAYGPRAEVPFNPGTDYKINSRHNARINTIGWVLPAGPSALSGYDLEFLPIAKL